MSNPYYYKHYTDYKKFYDYPSLDDTSESIYLELDSVVKNNPLFVCSVTLNFIDIITKIKISNSIVIKNLRKGYLTFEPKEILGYTIKKYDWQTADLTYDNPHKVVTFEYSQIVFNNEVPYISTYYIEPIVTNDEDVILNYYVDDFYHKKYFNEDTREIFTVTVNINGYPRISKKNVRAGDNYIYLGKFKNIGERNFSILCTDKQGRNSHELFNFFLVKNKLLIKEYIMTTKDLFKYNIDNTDSRDKVSTNRDGLQQLLDSKSIQGFNKVKLLPGIYRVDHLGTLYIPENFTLDMNTATIKLDNFVGDKALIMELKNTFDSHVINGTIEGDYFNHDYANSKNNSESVHGISISGKSRYSSFENLVVKDITGCGGITGMINSVDKYLDYTYLPPQAIGNTFKLGDIDRITGMDISSTNRTTGDFIDISGYSDIGYLSISRYLGEQGNACESFNLICHFYDINKRFIKSTDAYQYRRVEVPSTARFVRVTLLTLTSTSLLSYPTDLSIQLFKVPTHCAFKNIKFDNCRCGGISQGAMTDMLVENCEFSNCGQIPCKPAYEAQSGLDMMQDVTFKGLNFHDNLNSDFFTGAGHNFVVDGQIKGNISVLERAKALVIINCKNTRIDLQGGSVSTIPNQRITLQDGDMASILNHGIYRVYDNDFTYGTVANNLSKNIKCTGSLGGAVLNSTLGGLVTNSIYHKCIINVNRIDLVSIRKLSMMDCTFIPEPDFEGRYNLSFDGGHLEDNYFLNCTFKGESSLFNNNGFYSGKFLNCIFEDTSIFPSLLANEDDVIYFYNCTFGYSQNNFIYYYDKGVESDSENKKGAFTNIQFNKCLIEDILLEHRPKLGFWSDKQTPLIYPYSKPRGICKFIDCTLKISININLFWHAGYHLDYTDKYIVVYKNTPAPKKGFWTLKPYLFYPYGVREE